MSGPKLEFTVWTDGACQPNPGPGGWGYLMHAPGQEPREVHGGTEATTSNRMEMTAALEALRAVPDGAAVVLYSDSRYLVSGMNRWRHSWGARGWVRRTGSPPLNVDLWQLLDEQARRVQRVSFKWVKGHAGNPGNERADRLAELGRRTVLRSIPESRVIAVSSLASHLADLSDVGSCELPPWDC